MNFIKFKTIGLCICLFAFSNISQAQKKKSATVTATSYILEGNISGLEDGTTIQLIPGATHTSEPAVAETKSKDGKFTFTGKLSEPRLFYLEFGKNKGRILVLVENSKIKLTAETEVLKQEDGIIKFKKEVILGSKSNDYFKKETAYREELNKDYTEYHIGSEEVSKAYSNARVSNNKKLMDSIANSPEWKSFEAKEKAFFEKATKLANDLFLKHKDSWWGPFFMLAQMSYFTPEQKPIYEQFSETAKKSYYGQIVDKELNPKSLIGSTVFNYKLKDKDGKIHNAKDIIAGKKYTLIDLWASWCGPCRREIPNLKAAYSVYSAKGFEILSISIDKDENAWLKALEQENMQWTNLLDDKNIMNDFNVRTIPATFLVDSKGVIINDNLRGKALEEKLIELLQ